MGSPGGALVEAGRVLEGGCHLHPRGCQRARCGRPATGSGGGSARDAGRARGSGRSLARSRSSPTTRQGLTLWNPAAERVFGWTAEEGDRQDRAVRRERGRDARGGAHSVRERVVAGHAFSGFKTVRRRKDGTLIDVSFSNAPIRDAGGRIRGVVALVADVTDRKRTERELREGAERLRLALEASQMGTWEWDIESGVVTWSDEIAPMHGLEPGAFDGTYEQYETLIYPDDREFVGGAIEAALERGAGYDIEFRTAWPDGTIRWISGQGQVLRDHTGKPAANGGPRARRDRAKTAGGCARLRGRREREALVARLRENGARRCPAGGPPARRLLRGRCVRGQRRPAPGRGRPRGSRQGSTRPRARRAFSCESSRRPQRRRERPPLTAAPPGGGRRRSRHQGDRP